MPKTRNIIIFVSIAAVLVLAYIFFIRGPETPDTNLVVSPSGTTLPGIDGAATTPAGTQADSAIAADFLALLLNVKNIKLEDSLFSDPAWMGLKDSSITLIPDGTEGRPNPFAPFGSDTLPPPVNSLPQ